MKYMLLRGSHGRIEKGNNVRYQPGDEIDLSPAEAAGFGDRVRLAATLIDDEGTVDWKTLMADLSWKAAIELVMGLESLDEVAEAEQAERDGRRRPSVIKALVIRREELISEEE